MDRSKGTVAVIGAGLVGSVAASFFADRGYDVKVFEQRKGWDMNSPLPCPNSNDDIRAMEHVKGRSINMALSERGRSAMRQIQVEQIILRKAIPMYARYIHGDNGQARQILYGQKHQCIYSIDRRLLNEELITAAEDRPNVRFHFETKLIKCNADIGEITLYNTQTQQQETYRVDLVIGADGAYSATRRELMKGALFDYRQEYIPHGYMELSIPPNKDGEFAMPMNYLHIWPRNDFMMIGLPNPDKSFTVTLFMPFATFNAIKTEDDLIRFFTKYFNDAIRLIGEDNLKQLYFSGRPLPMISIKSSPHHFGDKAVLIGDAAHAMVPFYGQGMNCGLEDCMVLNDMLNKYDDNIEMALKAYSEQRVPDAQAIVDLAMYNYVEMRSHVNTWTYLARKAFDNTLYKILPNIWIPLYTSVSFTRIRYSQCISNKRLQDKLIGQGLVILGLGLLMATGFYILTVAHAADWPQTLLSGAYLEKLPSFLSSWFRVGEA